MSETIKVNGYTVTVVPPEEAESVLSESELEMDLRARETVKAAIHRAKICKNPIARYDAVSKRAYLETADGEKIYVK